MVNRWDPIGSSRPSIDADAILGLEGDDTAGDVPQLQPAVTPGDAVTRPALRITESNARLSYFEGREVSACALIKRHGIADRAAIRALAFDAALLNTFGVLDEDDVGGLVDIVKSQIETSPSVTKRPEEIRSRQARQIVTHYRRRVNETVLRELPAAGDQNSDLTMASLQQLWRMSYESMFPPRASSRVDRQRTPERGVELHRAYVDKLCDRTIAHLTEVWSKRRVRDIVDQPVYTVLVKKLFENVGATAAKVNRGEQFAPPEYLASLVGLVEVGRARLSATIDGNDSGWHASLFDLELAAEHIRSGSQQLSTDLLTSWLEIRGSANPASLDRLSLVQRFVAHGKPDREYDDDLHQRLVGVARAEILAIDPVALVVGPGVQECVSVLKRLDDTQLSREVLSHVFWAIVDDERAASTNLLGTHSVLDLVDLLIDANGGDLKSTVEVLERHTRGLVTHVWSNPGGVSSRNAISILPSRYDATIGRALIKTYHAELTSVPDAKQLAVLTKNLKVMGLPRAELLAKVVAGVAAARIAEPSDQAAVATRQLRLLRSRLAALSDGDAARAAPSINSAMGFFLALRSLPPDLESLLILAELRAHAIENPRSCGVEAAARHFSQFATPEACRYLVARLTAQLQMSLADAGRLDEHKRVWKWANAALTFVYAGGDAYPHDLVVVLNQHARLDTTGTIEGNLRRRKLFVEEPGGVEEFEPLASVPLSPAGSERPRLGRANVFRLAYERARRRLGSSHGQS